jgi:beta-lactamase superfamily II metal-dependent hydrolase
VNTGRCRTVQLTALVALLVASTVAQDPSARTLDIYVVDVEGGNATLLVSPSRQSLLIDTGNSGPAATRDAERIMAAAKDAAVTQIDHLITTHYHGPAFSIKVSARQDGSFTVTNARNAFSKTYAAR